MNSSKNQRERMVRICKLYYLENYTQSQIAKVVGISRSQVSRLLNEARRQGLVEIKIHENIISTSELEKLVKKKFNLVNVIIAESISGNYLNDISNVASDFLANYIEDGMIIGISWGRTLARTIDGIITSKRLRNTLFLPLLGGVGQMKYEFQMNTLVEKISNAFNASSFYLHAPAFFEDQKALEIMLKDGSIQIVTELWEKLDMAIVGIGEPISLSNAFKPVFSPDFLSMLLKQSAVGDIAARFFTEEGKPCDLGKYSKHILGITLEQLKNVPQVIGIAGGNEKISAIRAAIKGKFINSLVTDILTARELVKEGSKE
ncbi:MAG: sugar-binding transcriptional regulator [Kosmotoga sp.]|nr:MAG: sugar-binding transcriptional regulator [Kosmotoga sp.]